MCLEGEGMEERIRELELRVDALYLRTENIKPARSIRLVDYSVDDSWLVPGSRPEEQGGGLVMDKCLIVYEEPIRRSFLQKLFTFF
jgi:hypothetical protein